MAKQFEYEQQLEHLKISIEEIKAILDNKPILYAGIIHDKDENTEKHLHIMVKLLNSNMTPDMVCKWFKDEPQYINIKQSRWENKLAYLCHRTETSKDKYQYDPQEVFANFDYIEALEHITKEVERYTRIEDIIELISQGKIRGYNLTEHVDAKTYSVHKTRINNALEWYRRKVMTDKDRNITVIMISGPTGVGKTTYAKQFCRNSKKSFCISSSSNDPMQDYEGEDVLILDDIRDDAFKFHDFLKLLDNHTKSTTASRYNNKAFIGDTIILTTDKIIFDWYPGVDKETRKQLYRRVNILFDLTEERIEIYQYNEEKKAYDLQGSVRNILKMTMKENKKRLLDVTKAFGMELSPEVEARIMATQSFDDYKTLLEKIEDDGLPF